MHSSAISKGDQIITWCLGISFAYIMYNVGDKAEPRGSPDCIFLGVDISSTEIINVI
jgi:hypothetical protein